MDRRVLSQETYSSVPRPPKSSATPTPPRSLKLSLGTERRTNIPSRQRTESDKTDDVAFSSSVDSSDVDGSRCSPAADAATSASDAATSASDAFSREAPTDFEPEDKIEEGGGLGGDGGGEALEALEAELSGGGSNPRPSLASESVAHLPPKVPDFHGWRAWFLVWLQIEAVHVLVFKFGTLHGITSS
jgi:hypothetical protein